MKRVKWRISRGSHLPVLMKLVPMTKGPILEMGCGVYSTPFLHYSCLPTKRKLVTYEGDPQFYDYFSGCNTDWHEVYLVDDWDSIDLLKPWSIAFIDHSPGERRALDIKRVQHAEYIVAHDTERREAWKYNYQEIMDLFKYSYTYKELRPYTTVFSNKYELNEFKI